MKNLNEIKHYDSGIRTFLINRQFKNTSQVPELNTNLTGL